jgi:hypothetical protein
MVVPPVMRMVRPGSASDVPAVITIEGRSHDWLQLRFEAEDYVRIVVPDEVQTRRAVVLNEISGRVRANGRIGSRALDLEASGVFELLH